MIRRRMKVSGEALNDGVSWAEWSARMNRASGASARTGSETMTNPALFNGVFEDSRVLVTGHTGFKGTWLSLWLQHMGGKG